MVIIIMGGVKSNRLEVGRFLAQGLGWDFADLQETHQPPTLIASEQTYQIEALSAVVDCSIYAWRDTVIASPILSEDDRKRLGHNRRLVKFVRLSDPSADLSAFWKTQREPTDYRDNLLHVDCSQQMDQIMECVLSAYIFRRRSPEKQAVRLI